VNVTRGRLRPSTEAPQVGERVEEISRLGGVVVEQILSGRLAAAQDFKQDHDEWVVVLDGAAVLEVAAERLSLSDGDWALIPAGLSHRLVETQPGTRWLALHGPSRQVGQVPGARHTVTR
jgi:cupin 2 domain-containing protein